MIRPVRDLIRFGGGRQAPDAPMPAPDFRDLTIGLLQAELVTLRAELAGYCARTNVEPEPAPVQHRRVEPSGAVHQQCRDAATRVCVYCAPHLGYSGGTDG